MLFGVDVSNHQGAIDWAAVAASGRSFAVVKASEGVSFTDPYLLANLAGIRAAGMVRGVYHFARPSRNSAAQEAAHFLAVLSAAGGLLPGDLVALDMEDTDAAPPTADLLDWSLRWLKLVEQELGFTPLLYSGWWYMQPHGLHSHPEITGYPLWLAWWRDTWPQTTPGGWERITLWQATDQDEVPGIAGPCDGDRFTGTVQELRALGKPAAEGSAAALPATFNAGRVRELLGTAWGIAGGLDRLKSPYADQLRDVVVGIKEETGLP